MRCAGRLNGMSAMSLLPSAGNTSASRRRITYSAWRGRLWATPVLKPDPCHAFKGRAHAHTHRQPGIKLGLNGVHTIKQLLASLITGLAGLCQRDRRIGANGHALFFAADAVLPAPMLAPSGQGLQVEAATVGIAFTGLAFRAMHILARGVGQGHVGDFWLAQLGDCD